MLATTCARYSPTALTTQACGIRLRCFPTLEMFCWRRLAGLCEGDLSQQQHAGSNRRTDDGQQQQLRACHHHCSPSLALFAAASAAVGEPYEYPGGSSCWSVPVRLRPRGSGLGASGTGLGFYCGPGFRSGQVRSAQHSIAQRVVEQSAAHQEEQHDAMSLCRDSSDVECKDVPAV